MAAFDRIFLNITHEKFKTDRIFEVVKYSHPILLTTIGILFVLLLGWVDYLTGNEIIFSFFYLAPIVLVTWSVNQGMGLVTSVLSALAWLIAESTGDITHNLSIIDFWNTLIHVSFFVVITHLVSELKITQRKEQLAARTDFVTGLANRRYFHELLEMEIERIRRYPHPFIVVYMDVDNFKQVNDLFGHKRGDEVLCWIARELKSQLRKTDIIGRLGGDEFALLLPSVRRPEAEGIICKLRTHLSEEMRRRNWPVTFSMGAVVCVAPPHTAEQIIDMADEVMYEVKNSTKNNVHFITWDGKRFRRL